MGSVSENAAYQQIIVVLAKEKSARYLYTHITTSINTIYVHKRQKDNKNM